MMRTAAGTTTRADSGSERLRRRWLPRSVVVAVAVALLLAVFVPAAPAAPPNPPRVSVGSGSVVEGQMTRRFIRFVIALSGPSTSTVSVHYTTADQSATGGPDYKPKVETLTFNPGQTVKYRSVLVWADAAIEGDETFAVQLSAPVNATLGTATGIGTILDDDPNVGPRVSIGDGTAPETCLKPPSTVPVVVTLSVRQAVPVTVTVATVAGSATATVDYRTITKTLTFTADQTLKEVRVPITADQVAEGTEQLTMTLTLVGGPVQVGRAVGTLKILDCTPV